MPTDSQSVISCTGAIQGNLFEFLLLLLLLAPSRAWERTQNIANPEHLLIIIPIPSLPSTRRAETFSDGRGKTENFQFANRRKFGKTIVLSSILLHDPIACSAIGKCFSLHGRTFPPPPQTRKLRLRKEIFINEFASPIACFHSKQHRILKEFSSFHSHLFSAFPQSHYPHHPCLVASVVVRRFNFIHTHTRIIVASPECVSGFYFHFRVENFFSHDEWHFRSINGMSCSRELIEGGKSLNFKVKTPSRLIASEKCITSIRFQSAHSCFLIIPPRR